jgi:hypothetical protein
MGTATIPMVPIGAVSPDASRVLAAFLACSVLHLQSSHFATTDIPMTAFMVALWFALGIAEARARTAPRRRPRIWRRHLVKTGGFVLGVIDLPTVFLPGRRRSAADTMGTLGRRGVPILSVWLSSSCSIPVWRYFESSSLIRIGSLILNGVTKPSGRAVRGYRPSGSVLVYESAVVGDWSSA